MSPVLLDLDGRFLLVADLLNVYLVSVMGTRTLVMLRQVLYHHHLTPLVNMTSVVNVTPLVI